MNTYVTNVKVGDVIYDRLPSGDDVHVIAKSIRGTCMFNNKHATYRLDIVASHNYCTGRFVDMKVLISPYTVGDHDVVSFMCGHVGDWRVIEKFVPREEWPREIFAGEDCPEHDTPDTQLREIIDEFKVYASRESGNYWPMPIFLIQHQTCGRINSSDVWTVLDIMRHAEVYEARFDCGKCRINGLVHSHDDAIKFISRDTIKGAVPDVSYSSVAEVQRALDDVRGEAGSHLWNNNRLGFICPDHRNEVDRERDLVYASNVARWSPGIAKIESHDYDSFIGVFRGSCVYTDGSQGEWEVYARDQDREPLGRGRLVLNGVAPDGREFHKVYM